MIMESDQSDDCLDHFDPLAFVARASDPDTPKWNDAMYSPNVNIFWDAMYAETLGLLKVKAWSQVQRTPDISIILVTCAFQIKRFSSGLICRYKVRFYICGDLQQDDTESYLQLTQMLIFNSSQAGDV